VEFAVELHRAMDAANATLPEANHVVLRIGINLGRRHRRRIRPLWRRRQSCRAAPNPGRTGWHLHFGGGPRSDRDKVQVAFQDIGEPAMKNIGRPVRAFHSKVGAEATKDSGGRDRADDQGQRDQGQSARKPSIAVLPFTQYER